MGQKNSESDKIKKINESRSSKQLKFGIQMQMFSPLINQMN